MTLKEKPLSPKQAAFVREYLVDLVAKQAAIRAGYSPKTADKQGSQLLDNPRVAAEIQRAMDKRARKTEITAEKVLKDIERVRDLAEKNGELTTALKASELQGKHLKLFTDKIDVGGQADNPLHVLLSQISGASIAPRDDD